MEETKFPIFALIPLMVFGPLFLWMLYNFGLRELVKMPGELKRQRERDRKAQEKLAIEHARKRGPVRPASTGPEAVSIVGWIGQGVCYLLFVALIGYFSTDPPYTYLEPDKAVVKLSLSHPGRRKVACRRRSRKELAKLAPNMRAQMDCPRERWPVLVEVDLDGKRVYRKSVAPAGLAGDGASSFYERFTVPAGSHRVRVRMGDKGAKQPFDYVREASVTLAPAHILLIGFDETEKKLFIKSSNAT